MRATRPAVQVRIASIELDRRTTHVRASGDGHPAFPHVLRGTLAALLAEPGWRVVVTFDGVPEQPSSYEVLAEAREWASARGCALAVWFG